MKKTISMSFSFLFLSLTPPSYSASVSVKEEHNDHLLPADAAPPPSSLMPSPLKKRRRISASQHLPIDIRPTHDQTSASTPIFPVVIGFSIPPENIPQVRNMLNVKQKQKAIIDQRRGSITGSPTCLEDRRQPKQQQQTPTPRTRCPNSVPRPSQRPPNPQKQQQQQSLPLPSFAPLGRVFNQMPLPRLPAIALGPDNPHRVPGNVPPTPTRLSLQLQRTQPTIHWPLPNCSPGASVPIATTLIPPTPTTLDRPGYTGDKAAFLAPFDCFYDALNDSKQLKVWLADQLQQTLVQQQEQMKEIVKGTVEERVGGMRAELMALRRRVDELEEAMGQRSAPPKQINDGVHTYPNINSVSPEPAYTFPPPSSFSRNPFKLSSCRLTREGSKPELPRQISSQTQLNDPRHSVTVQSPLQMYRERDAPPRRLPPSCVIS